jgi:glyoxylase-like metal-dependent hydrolase (beta-lactamase superfamily II)
MRRSVPAAIFAVLLAAAFHAAPQDGPSPRVKLLAPGVFYWQGDRETRRQTNCAWVVFRDYVLVIDANFPWGAREILADLRKTTDRPVRYVFNTHYHADHAYGNSVFTDAGAAIVGSEDCAEESRRKGARDAANQAKGSTEPVVHPTLLFPDRLVFDDGVRRVELTKVGPAHTKGDAVAYLPHEKILFVGDLAVNWTYGNNVSDVDADHANWVRVLDRLAGWDAAVVAPGHGELGTPAILKGQRAYLAEMLEKVQAGIAAGKTADQLSQEIDLTRHRPFGAEPQRTAGQVRSMFRRLSSRNP